MNFHKSIRVSLFVYKHSNDSKLIRLLRSAYFLITYVETTMNSLISEVILTIFTITLEIFIFVKNALKEENLNVRKDGFYIYIFYPLMVVLSIFFTSLVLTLCLAVRSQSCFFCFDYLNLIAVFFSDHCKEVTDLVP